MKAVCIRLSDADCMTFDMSKLTLKLKVLQMCLFDFVAMKTINNISSIAVASALQFSKSFINFAEYQENDSMNN